MRKIIADGPLRNSRLETGSIAIAASCFEGRIFYSLSGLNALDSRENPCETGSLTVGLSNLLLQSPPCENGSGKSAELSKPLVIDLFTGLHGWLEAFLAEGYRCVGYDIEDMCASFGKPRPEGIELRLRDVRLIHGSEFKDAAVIVASPPCQRYSYMAMPWSRAKDQAREIEADTTGQKLRDLNELFETCFRLQREASEAAGRHIPLIVENVRGAQKWVGRAPWNYGSFYLWGDVPALMPHTFKAQKVNPDGTNHPPGSWFAIADSKNRGVRGGCTCPTECDCQNPEPTDGGVALISEECPIHNWNERPALTCPVHGESVAAGIKTVGHANIRDGHTHTRHLTNQRESDALRKIDESGTKGGGDWFGSGDDCSLQRRYSGTKQAGISSVRENGKGDKWFQDGAAKHGSRSNARKAASAMIAKIPEPLARHIARTFKP